MLAMGIQMMNWAANQYFDFPRKVPGPYHLLTPHPIFQPRRRTVTEARLPDDLPGYLVYVTRNALLGATTSLTKASGDAHSFFSNLNQMLMFERMMRTFLSWGVPSATASGFAMPQPWLLSAPQPQLLSFWGTNPALPIAQSYRGNDATQSLALAQTSFPVFAAMMAVPASFLALVPTAMDAWRIAL